MVYAFMVISDFQCHVNLKNRKLFFSDCLTVIYIYLLNKLYIYGNFSHLDYVFSIFAIFAPKQAQVPQQPQVSCLGPMVWGEGIVALKCFRLYFDNGHLQT